MKMKNKLVISLVGGICSGKTTFKNEVVRSGHFVEISKDQCIYESDMLCRIGVEKSWDEIRDEKISKLSDENVILDETLRVGKLDKLKAKGYTIVAVIMELNYEKRCKRLSDRNELNAQYMKRLSEITGLELMSYTQEERRKLWKSQEFRDALPEEFKCEFDEILEKSYLLGSKTLKMEEPNPVCFKQIDYIVNYDDLMYYDGITNDDIIAQCMSYDEYKKIWARNIKYCIWDVGGVFYNYSLDTLHAWGMSHSVDMNVNRRYFSFNDYMKGVISFDELCKSFCNLYNIDYQESYNDEISRCLFAGIGEPYEETELMIKYIKSKNVTNCVLSNALPLLASDGNYPELIDTDKRFYSFVFHKLKPENDIYKMVQEQLGVPFNQMIFIDDKQKNVDAAIDLGIYSIVYNRKTIKDEIESIFGNL